MSKPKILIVDDSQLNREILSCMLEDKYDICEAENGKQAVEILERCHKNFKLVLLDLIMPVASLLPLERRVLWNERLEIPRKVLDAMADGAEDIAAALKGPLGIGLVKVLSKLPKGGRVASAAAVPVFLAAADAAGPKLKELNVQARANLDYLTATLTQFKLDLDQGVKDRLLIRSLK